MSTRKRKAMAYGKIQIWSGPSGVAIGHCCAHSWRKKVNRTDPSFFHEVLGIKEGHRYLCSRTFYGDPAFSGIDYILALVHNEAVCMRSTVIEVERDVRPRKRGRAQP